MNRVSELIKLEEDLIRIQFNIADLAYRQDIMRYSCNQNELKTCIKILIADFDKLQGLISREKIRASFSLANSREDMIMESLMTWSQPIG